MSASPDRFSQHRPRLYDPENLGGNPAGPPGHDSPELRLSQIYERWFLPVILRGERGSSENTIKGYGEAVAWWVKITKDPPAWEIDEFTTATFAEKLPITPYKRGINGKDRYLAKHTCEKHKGCIRSILLAISQRKSLVDQSAKIVVRRPRHSKPKPCFALSQARKVYAATQLCDDAENSLLHWPHIPGCRPSLWWQGFLALLFYTGMRVSSVLALKWDHADDWRDDGLWLDVPEELIEKTHKWKEMPFHTEAQRICEMLRPWSGNYLLPRWPHSRKFINTVHSRLQLAAGIRLRKNRPLELQAWRRTYSDQLARLGLDFAQEVARRALDHSDLATTTGHYCSMEHELMWKLPQLRGDGGHDPQLTLF